MAEKCDDVSKWWILPVLLVLYLLTITYTSANKCVFLTTEPRLSEWLQRRCLWLHVVVEVHNNGWQSGVSSHHPLLLENGKQKHWNVKAFLNKKNKCENVVVQCLHLYFHFKVVELQQSVYGQKFNLLKCEVLLLCVILYNG